MSHQIKCMCIHAKTKGQFFSTMHRNIVMIPINIQKHCTALSLHAILKKLI